jgi:tetrahydromethanopterin S-methyltransferase subunit F
MLGGLFAGIMLVRPAGSDPGMLPLAVVLVGIPAYIGLLAAVAIGRMIGDHLDI